MPIAIAISGVLILVLDALPIALTVTIAVTFLVCLVWTWSAVLLYRAYGPALAEALRRRRMLDPDADLASTDDDEAVARQLLVSADPRASRLGLDLLSRVASPRTADALASLTDDPRPEVRLTALTALATPGDADAQRRLAVDVRTLVDSPDPAVRWCVAGALPTLGADDRAAAASLLHDADIDVRNAALEAVRAGDQSAVAAVIASLDDPRSVAAAAGAVARLGDAVVPILAERLDAAGSPAPPSVLRLIRAATTRTPARDQVLRRHIDHPDRELGLVVMERLVAPGPAPDETARALDTVLAGDTQHAARILAAMVALESAGSDADDADGPIRRALADEFDLVRSRVATGVLARYGADRLGSAMTRIDGGGAEGALAVEAVEVTLGSAASRTVLPILEPDLSVTDRLARLGTPPDAPRDPNAALRDLIEDGDRRWRSTWVRACAIHAARARGRLDQIDLTAAQALHDPIVDEELEVMTSGS